MKGHENLIPNRDRSPEELRRMCSEGGRRSVESRRKKREQREIMQNLLEAVPDLDSKTVENLKKLGFIQGNRRRLTVAEIICAALIQKAMRGDIRAVELVFKVMGYFDNQSEVNVKIDTATRMEEVEKFLYSGE